MNYFEFYGLAVSFDIDEDQLRKQYLQKSKDFHPDFYTANSNEQLEAVEKTSLNNQAFGTLKSFEKRVKYILEIHDLLEEGKSSVPQAFLMEMMDFNEKLMDLKMDPNPALQREIEAEFNQMQDELKAELEGLANDYDTAERGEEKTAVLLKVKDNYLKQKYLNRIQENLNAEM